MSGFPEDCFNLTRLYNGIVRRWAKEETARARGQPVDLAYIADLESKGTRALLGIYGSKCWSPPWPYTPGLFAPDAVANILVPEPQSTSTEPNWLM